MAKAEVKHVGHKATLSADGVEWVERDPTQKNKFRGFLLILSVNESTKKITLISAEREKLEIEAKYVLLV